MSHSKLLMQCPQTGGVILILNIEKHFAPCQTVAGLGWNTLFLPSIQMCWVLSPRHWPCQAAMMAKRKEGFVRRKKLRDVVRRRQYFCFYQVSGDDFLNKVLLPIKVFKRLANWLLGCFKFCLCPACFLKEYIFFSLNIGKIHTHTKCLGHRSIFSLTLLICKNHFYYYLYHLMGDITKQPNILSSMKTHMHYSKNCEPMK